MENPSYYAVIPANVRYDREITDKAKLLYGEITALCNKNGVCTASNAYFANLYGVNATTISTLINTLVKRGYLESEIIYKEGTKEIQNRYLKISKDPLLKNQKENNTSNNNIPPIIPPRGDTMKTDQGSEPSQEEKLKHNFEIIWDEYPRKDDKQRAFRRYVSWIKGKKKVAFGKSKLTNQEMLKAVRNYNRYLEDNNISMQYTKMGSTFFNEGILNYLPREDESDD